jgi:hypothetical protein
MPSTEPARQRWADQHRNSGPCPSALPQRQAFQYSRTAASPIVHAVKTLAMLSPLVVSEFVKDPDKQFKYARMAILGATLIDQVMWATHVRRDAKERQRCRKELWAERCRSASPERLNGPQMPSQR